MNPPNPAASAPTRLREDLIHPDPLLDCLVEVARLHGQAASRASLSASLPLVDGRLTLDLAERAAARAGLSARLQRMGLDEIDSAALPVQPRHFDQAIEQRVGVDQVFAQACRGGGCWVRWIHRAINR